VPLLAAALAWGVILGTPQREIHALPDADDVHDVPAQSYFVGGDLNKEYVVIGKTSSRPKKLCVVMPGGPGGIEFLPFVKRILKFGLEYGWMVVEPIAVKWSDDPSYVVWPSATTPYAPAKFTTETFLDGILDELPSRLKMQIDGTYLLGWSSSGPAIYSYAGHGKHEIKGAFVAMSVFDPKSFGGQNKLRVGRFYLLHSPQDFIPMSHPEAAKAALSNLGIPVKLDTYQGGHGWHGSVFDEIRDGMTFLATKA